jgi:endonuclease III
MPSQQKVIKELLTSYGHTFTEDAGIRLKNTPQPLYQTLVLACLLSARIRSSAAVASARELREAGLHDPRRMAESDWQERVDALGRGGYRRYDERTATQLGDGAQLVLDRWGGDLRRMRDEAGGDLEKLRGLLQEVPGLGPAGADIFLREVQAVWPEASPYLDAKAREGAKRLGLPDAPPKLARLAGDAEPAVFAAALVRAAVDKNVAEECKRAAEESDGD